MTHQSLPRSFSGQDIRFSLWKQGFNSPTGYHYGRIAQLGEHLPYKQGVIGSSPIVTTIVVGVQLSWLERLPVTQEVASSSLVTPAITYAALAHLVEQLTCNQQVIGSTPISGTSKMKRTNICGDGGIGRRARLRIQCPRRESSSLSLRTTLKKSKSCGNSSVGRA